MPPKSCRDARGHSRGVGRLHSTPTSVLTRMHVSKPGYHVTEPCRILLVGGGSPCARRGPEAICHDWKSGNRRHACRDIGGRRSACRYSRKRHGWPLFTCHRIGRSQVLLLAVHYLRRKRSTFCVFQGRDLWGFSRQQATPASQQSCMIRSGKDAITGTLGAMPETSFFKGTECPILTRIKTALCESVPNCPSQVRAWATDGMGGVAPPTLHRSTRRFQNKSRTNTTCKSVDATNRRIKQG